MDNYQENLAEEKSYLKKTLILIRNILAEDAEALTNKRRKLIEARKDMWENTVHFSNDFDRLTEINQYLSELNNQTANYGSALQKTKLYKRMIDSPYFGRFDLAEDNTTTREKIYIGLANLMDDQTHEIYIYDWRAPIASIFYRSELGQASYNAPLGVISGNVLLKRQYKIKNSKLQYFFDCSVRINDEILQEVLSGNASAKMQNIVATIQKEQDLIIRDTENELLIVQGVAGSGKTSIALHRIAFLLYEGMNSNIGSNNIIIISPNNVFSKYISSVLPELGEENVVQSTFDDIAVNFLNGRLVLEARNQQLESLIISRDTKREKIMQQSIDFKGSRVFWQMLDRLIKYYERRLIPFEDVYYAGEILYNKQQLKNLLLDNKIGMPMTKRLKIIENKILEKLHPLQKKRLKKIEQIVQQSEGHDLEIKSFSRLLAIKQANAFMGRLHKFTQIDYLYLYKLLFNNSQLFFKIADGLELPANITQIISGTKETLAQEQGYYEDCAPLLYLKLRLEGCREFGQIKQVVIDEAQDYYPLQYEVFKLLFKDVRYTVLGDINQAIEKNADNSLYDMVTETFHKNKSVKLSLNKSYRSSFEINAFNQQLLDSKQDLVSFERHEAEPILVCKDTPELLDQAIANDIADYLGQGYESIAVIGKTWEQTEQIYGRLKNLTNIKIVNEEDTDIEKGALVIPVYMAKGLEFDVVLVYGASKDDYANEFDKKLLYIACTRALHRLGLYYLGEKSQFI